MAELAVMAPSVGRQTFMFAKLQRDTHPPPSTVRCSVDSKFGSGGVKGALLLVDGVCRPPELLSRCTKAVFCDRF